MNAPEFLDLEEARVRDPADELFSPVAGGLVGAAAGDALGWITEFVRGIDHLRKLYKTDWVSEYRPWQKTTGGRFNAYVDHINKGEYSDDTQLTLAIARSINADGSANPDHFASRELPLWLDYARGAGATITAAARGIKRKSARWNRNFFTYRLRGRDQDYRHAGANGAAMRIGPLALANVQDPSVLYQAVWETSIATHGHPRAILGALMQAEALRYSAEYSKRMVPRDVVSHLVSHVSDAEVPDTSGIAEWLSNWEQRNAKPFAELWSTTRKEAMEDLHLLEHFNGSISDGLRELGCFDPATKGSGISTVLGAVLIFAVEGEDFRKAVLNAVNQLGADTDTIAGFVGGLCGCFHGYEEMPEEWAVGLQDYDYFMRVALELARVSVRRGIGSRALLPDATQRSHLPNLLELLRSHRVNAKERVHHPLFGAGWVEAVDAQKLRRKDGAEVVFARVLFDLGQSCKFRYMQIPGRQRKVSRRRPVKPAPGKLFT